MKLHSIPGMTTDEAAEAVLDQDLSDLDFSAFRPLDWEGRDKRAGGRAGEAHDAGARPSCSGVTRG